MAQNVSAPVLVRKEPETFCLILIMRTSRSTKLLSKGTRKSYIKASTCDLCCWRRSSKFLGGDCFLRPRCLWGGSGGGGLASTPWAIRLAGHCSELGGRSG